MITANSKQFLKSKGCAKMASSLRGGRRGYDTTRIKHLTQTTTHRRVDEMLRFFCMGKENVAIFSCR